MPTGKCRQVALYWMYWVCAMPTGKCRQVALYWILVLGVSSLTRSLAHQCPLPETLKGHWQGISMSMLIVPGLLYACTPPLIDYWVGIHMTSAPLSLQFDWAMTVVNERLLSSGVDVFAVKYWWNFILWWANRSSPISFLLITFLPVFAKGRTTTSITHMYEILLANTIATLCKTEECLWYALVRKK